jgi:predicted amidohydrolase
MKVACVQVLTNDNIQQNLNKIKKLILRAIKQKADLIITPEVSSVFSFDKKSLKQRLTSMQKDFFVKAIQTISRKYKKWILIGSITSKENNRLFNRSVLLDPKGRVNTYYDKIHMFDVKLNKKETYAESKTFTAGKKIKVANLPWGKLGLSICYDLRFPNHYRTMAKRGAKFLAVPSNFLLNTGKRHWHSLLRARAIENFCYVFAPAQYGTHDNGIKVFGHSLIISPDGKILKELKKGEGVIVQKIDVKLPQLLRNKIPSLNKN